MNSSFPYFYIIILIVLSNCTEPTPITDNNPKQELAMVKPTKTKQEIPIKENPPKEFDVDYLMGKFDPTTHSDFVEIKKQHASRGGMFLRKDAYDAFITMATAATKEGISLKILSATRPFKHQKSIWENKWNGGRKVNGADLSKTISDHKLRALKILEYSSMPGTSRHHWGTDIDINAFENSYFEKGQGKKEYDWLVANAAQYGFCQPYTSKGTDRPHGYNEEKWHWSYLPVSIDLTKNAEKKMNDSMIKGFDGAETAPQIKVVEKYILGINKACR